MIDFCRLLYSSDTYLKKKKKKINDVKTNRYRTLIFNCLFESETGVVVVLLQWFDVKLQNERCIRCGILEESERMRLFERHQHELGHRHCRVQRTEQHWWRVSLWVFVCVLFNWVDRSLELIMSVVVCLTLRPASMWYQALKSLMRLLACKSSSTGLSSSRLILHSEKPLRSCSAHSPTAAGNKQDS